MQIVYTFFIRILSINGLQSYESNELYKIITFSFAYLTVVVHIFAYFNVILNAMQVKVKIGTLFQQVSKTGTE